MEFFISKVEAMKREKLLKTGTTTIGAISSYSFDLEACLKSPINTIFFCEVIGSKADMIDTLFTDFKARLKDAQKHNSKRFKAGIAIHSPYSVHPFLVREVLNIAKEEKLPVTSHFLESKDEKDWLNYILENSETVSDLFADAFTRYFVSSKGFSIRLPQPSVDNSDWYRDN